jgi:heat shock protein HslJ
MLVPVAAPLRTPWLGLFGFVLLSCAVNDDGSPTGSELSGRVFVSESVVGRELVPNTEIRLSFRSSELSANAGCNSMFGNYRFEEDALVVSALGMTEIGCDPPLSDQDVWLAAFLIARPTAELAEPRLTLSSTTESLILLDREVASPDRPLVDTHWVGNGVGDGSGVTFGPGWDAATITFGSDGHVEAFSGCQLASGTFTAREASIDFADFAYDGLPCADTRLVGLSERFLFVLDGSEVSFEIEERSLRIERAGSTLYFLATE